MAEKDKPPVPQETTEPSELHSQIVLHGYLLFCFCLSCCNLSFGFPTAITSCFPMPFLLSKN